LEFLDLEDFEDLEFLDFLFHQPLKSPYI
jgi:hypothetical protein